MNEHKLFHINQDAIIKNSAGQYLLLKQKGKWKLPGGRMEEGETPPEALRREIKEETGIVDFVIKEVLEVGISDSRKTYLVSFLCETPDNPDVKLSHEHTEYVWANLESVDQYDFWNGTTKDKIKKAK